MTTFHIITLFPNAFDSYLGESILKRAIEDKKIKVKFYNPRDFAIPKNGKKKASMMTYAERRVDNRPYGGGPGMVIEALPVIKAIERAMKKSKCKMQNLKSKVKSEILNSKFQVPNKFQITNSKIKIIFFSPSGKQFTNNYADKISKNYSDIILICGRYEGIDARVKKAFKMEEVSIGPFVLTGGELPAMIVIDSISRRIPGVLGDINSLEESRVSSSDVYTRPEIFEYKGKKYRVPKILLSGHRAKIEEWKKGKSK
jgi:tRNA (guanine37-N1)-methyltransferase